MRILIIGASQGTGALAAKNALDKGHSVTAFSRNPAKLILESSKLSRIAGDFHNAKSVEDAVKGHDAVIVTASSTSLKGFKENPQYFSQGTAFVIEGMKKHQVKRLVILSALGAGETRPLAGYLLRVLIIDGMLRAPFTDHGVQEELVKKSGLDWVIARPGRLTDGPARGKYVKKAALESVPMSISRADVADFLVDACTSDQWIAKGVQLGG